jgi:hypothetical protein
MPGPSSKRYAYNRTRKAYLATSLVVADSHWSRFRGLMATDAGRFSTWIRRKEWFTWNIIYGHGEWRPSV